MTERPMSVEYEIAAQDLYNFQWRAVFRSNAGRRGRRRTYGSLLFLFVFIAILPAIGTDGFRLSWVNWIAVGVVFAIVATFYWVAERVLMRRAILSLVRREEPEKGQLGRHRVVLEDNGVFESTAVGESRTAWAGVNRIEQDADYIFIYTTVSSALLIPKRAFTATGAADFFEEATARHGAAR